MEGGGADFLLSQALSTKNEQPELPAPARGE